MTSLPGNGAGPSQGAPYVTLVGPASSKLVSVSTSDVVDAATAPPSGTTLPAGLTSFTLADITPGSTQTVSVYGGPMAGVNGYAKYDAGIWSVLPAERVQVFADHVDILLTDGGPGDDDGIANGQITDPGGIAVMSVAAGDITPPVVTGEATTEPNSAGDLHRRRTPLRRMEVGTAATSASRDGFRSGLGGRRRNRPTPSLTPRADHS